MLFFVATSGFLTSCLVPQGNLPAAMKLQRTEPLPQTPSRSGVVFGPDPANKLDIYFPKATSRGTILYFHSGGWVVGHSLGVTPIIKAQVKRGWAVVSAGYRLAKLTADGQSDITIQQILEDADRALRFIRYHASDLGLNVSRVIVAGGSAGGHIATMLATAPGEFVDANLSSELTNINVNVDGVISLAGPTDLGNFASYADEFLGGVAEVALGCTREVLPQFPLLPPCNLEYVRRMSPLYWASKAVESERRLPPAYLGYGKLDTLVRWRSQGLALEKVWSKTSGSTSVWLDIPPKGVHDVDWSLNRKAFERWLDLVATGRL